MKFRSLSSFYSEIPDPRQKSGLRHELVPFLMMCTISILSGYSSNNSMAKYMKNNRDELTQLFNLKHGTPGHTQIGTIFNLLDPAAMMAAFNKWAAQFRTLISSSDGVSGDGKALGATVENSSSSSQSFQAIVSFFAHEKQLVLALSSYDNGKESEIPCVYKLLDTLANKGIILTLDALHCQKKQ